MQEPYDLSNYKEIESQLKDDFQNDLLGVLKSGKSTEEMIQMTDEIADYHKNKINDLYDKITDHHRNKLKNLYDKN